MKRGTPTYRVCCDRPVTLFDNDDDTPDAAAFDAAADRVVIYTDGACSGNPGPGGWAWAVSPSGKPHGSGGAAATTNQRMELQAALEALKAYPVRVEIVSDSTYVVNCFRDGWWQGWLKRGWINSQKQPVANRDIWEPLIRIYRERPAGAVTFRWVKGHSGDKMNDIVDALAVIESQQWAGR